MIQVFHLDVEGLFTSIKCKPDLETSVIAGELLTFGWIISYWCRKWFVIDSLPVSEIQFGRNFGVLVYLIIRWYGSIFGELDL